jgi:polysaccharide biosynthesis transport protein
MDMLVRKTRVDHGAGREDASGSMSALIDQVTGLIRRQYRVILVVPAAVLAIGLLYLLVTPAQYTATATLLIDSTTLRVLQNQLQPQGDVPLDTLQVGSQVEILAGLAAGFNDFVPAAVWSRCARKRTHYTQLEFRRV